MLGIYFYKFSNKMPGYLLKNPTTGTCDIISGFYYRINFCFKRWYGEPNEIIKGVN